MKKTTPRQAVQKRIAKAQVEADRAISRGYKAALEMLPSGPRKVVKDLASQIETTAEQLTERGEKAFKLADKRRKALLGQVEKAAKAFERRGTRALATVEARSNKLRARLEQVAADAVRPIAHTLDLATLSDVRHLGNRLAQVERRVSGRRRAA